VIQTLFGNKKEKGKKNMLARSLFRGIRSFSTAASEATPPLRLHGIEGTYATALFSVASKTNKIVEVEKDLQKLNNAISNDSQLKVILSSPLLNHDQRTKTAEALASLLNLGGTTSNLLVAMAEYGRLGHVDKVSEGFFTLLDAQRGIVPVTIISADELSQEKLGELEVALKKSGLLQANQNPVIRTETNSELIGGFVVEIGDRTVDLSIASKINSYSKAVLEQPLSF
jgi:F-type H+-transporting ATPase subunit O